MQLNHRITSEVFVAEALTTPRSIGVSNASANNQLVVDGSSECDFVAHFSHLKEDEIPFLITACLCAFVGLVYTFLGNRLVNVVLFLTGFLFGTVLIYLVCDREDFLPPLGNAGIATGAGILVGLITVLIKYVGIFLTGFLTGLFMGVAIVCGVSMGTPLTTMWASVGGLFGTGILFAVLSLKWKRIFIVFDTAIVGSALVTIALDYSLTQFRLISQIKDVLILHQPEGFKLPELGPCIVQAWIAIASWPLFFLLGSITQLKCTNPEDTHAKLKSGHSKAIKYKKGKKPSSNPSPRDQRHQRRSPSHNPALENSEAVNNISNNSHRSQNNSNNNNNSNSSSNNNLISSPRRCNTIAPDILPPVSTSRFFPFRPFQQHPAHSLIQGAQSTLCLPMGGPARFFGPKFSPPGPPPWFKTECFVESPPMNGGLTSGSHLSAPPHYAVKPYRQVYQARRTHGDVITQSYLQCLHRYSSVQDTTTGIQSPQPPYSAHTDMSSLSSNSRLAILN